MTELINSIYIYCTDFTITSANLIGITYEDFNALIFCVIWPLLTIVSLITLFVQIYLRHKKI